MAKYSNVVEYNIVTDVDTSGIVKLQNELTKLKQSLKFDKSGFSQLGFDDAKIEKSIQKVNQLQTAITAAFNPKIGTIDLSKLNASLQKEHTSLQMIVKDWEQMGTRGTTAISNLSNALLSMNKGAINVNTTLSKIANTFGNTVRWGITASIFQEMMSSVQGAVSYMKDLDESLTQIQMVTNSSKEDMRELAQYANNAAQALGSTTTDYTNAVKVFVQEGFSASESKQYANLSTKLANVSEQNTATTSDQITAYRNAFQLDYEQTVAAMDKVANVANNTASNVNELMTASQRAASVAQAVGSSQDSFLAAIATIESVTRQSAEEIGNGLKTIYQRFADIKVGDSTEDGVDYGQYADALKSVGVDVLDVAGQFKGMDQILSELQDVWSELDDTMKIAVGEKVAGKFQYNRFAALMNNPEYYQKALGATQNADGMMDQMNEYYMQGIEGRLKTLQAAGEQVMSTLFNQDDVEPVIENVTYLVNSLNDLVEAMGGLNGVLPVISALMLRTFSTQIASTATNIATSIATIFTNTRNANQLQAVIGLVGLSNYGQAQGQNSVTGKLVAGVADKYDQLSVQTKEKLSALSQQIVELERQQTDILREQEQYYRKIIANANEEKVLIDEQLYTLGSQIQLLEEKQKISGLTTEENEELVLLREQAEKLAKIRREYSEIVRVCFEYAKAIANGEPVTQKMVLQVEKWKQETQGLNFNVSRLVESTERLGTASNSLKIGEKMAEASISTVNLEARLNSITRALGTISSLSIGVTMVTDSIKVLSDESATADEKFRAFTLDGLMGITMMLPAFVDLIKMLKTAKEGSLAFAAAERIRAAASALANGAMLLNPAVLAGLAAVAVVVGTVVTAYQAIYGAVNQANKELEEQQKILKQTKDSYQALDEKVEDLTTKMESISDTKQSLSEMAKGTEEWKNKVEELNDQVYELLEAYPELIEFVKSENGILSIDTEDKEYLEYITDLKNQKTQARQSTLLQQGNVKNAENNAQLESFKLKYGVDNLTLDDISNKSIDELKNSIDSSRKDYDNVITALTNLKQTVDTNNTYLDNVNSTVSKSLGYTNYAGTKISAYENQDLSQYQTTREIATASSQKNSITGTSRTTYGKTRVTEWDTSKEEIQEAIKQYYPDLKNITEIASVNTPGNPHGISFKYTDEEGKSAEKTIDETEVETVLKTYLQSSQYISDSFTKNAEIFKMFGAVVDETTQEFKDSEGNVIISLDELGFVTKEQAEIMSKFANDTDYEAFMSAVYDGADNFAKEIASGNYAKNSKFADYEAGIQAFSDTEAFEAFKESKLIARSPEAQSIREEYNNFETLEDFTRAVKDNVIQLDGLAEAVKELTPNMVDLTTNINGNEFTNRIDISSDEEKFKDFLEDSGMSEGAFNRMSRDAYEEESGYYQTNKENLEKDIESQKEFIATLKEGDEALEEEQQKLAGMQSELEDLDDAAKDTTAAILRMSNGVVTLRNKISDISEILTNDALEGTTEWYQALNDLDKGLSEVLNIDAGTLSDTFIESGDALAYAQRMAEGDMSAIDDLRIAAAQDIVQNLAIQVDPDENVDTIRSELMADLNQLQTEISSGKITVMTDLDTNPFIQRLDEMLAKGQVSAEQASQILSSIGMDAKIEHKKGTGYVQQISYHPRFTSDAVEIGEGGPRFPGIEMVPEMTSVKTEIDIPYLVGAHYTGSGVQTASAAARNPSYTGGYSKNPTPKSNSGSSPKSNSSKQPKNNQAKENAKNEWDYLTDITNDLDRQAAIIEKLSKLEDRLYGANRVSQLKKLQSEYKKNIKLLQQETKLAEKHANRLRTKAYDENGNLTINAYANRAGFSQIGFDAKGNIENGQAIEAALTQKVNNAIAEYNIHRNDEDDNTVKYYEEQVRLAQEDHDGFMKALSEYESTLGVIEDSQSQIQEYREKIQDAADAIIDTIQESIKNVIETIDKRRDFNRSVREWREGGEGYSHFKSDRQYFSEGLQEFFSSKSGINGQSNLNLSLDNLRGRLSDAENVFDKNPNNADSEKLKEAQALENLKEATELVSDNINTIVENYNSLLDTIGEMSSKMDDIIEDRLQQYDNIEDFLDTRLDQLKLLFGEDYGAQVRFYNQKINNNMSKMVDINTAIEEKQATVEQLEKLESSDKKLSTENRQMLNDARNEITKLQQELNITAKETNQLIRDRLGDQTRGEMQKMTNDMFGGNDVEWIAQQWEIASRNSSQYLDDYNRAFELQKLQLKYQDLLNDSQETSLSIQQRISVHMNDQLGFLRNKKKLSEYDVQYAQKQLEILQKQIALEEARDNKSQMRLQRNAAGNYDFVYAADENAVNQAAEALLNAQQEAYNLSKKIYLDTYNSAIEAALKTKEAVVEIALDASIDTAEKQERIKYVLDNLKEYMDNSSVELKNISINLYNDFIEADNKIAEENLGALSEVYQKIKDEYTYALEEMKNSSNDTVISMQEQYADALKEMETSSDNAITSMKNHLNNYLGTEGEGQAPGTARYVFNQFDTLGNTTFNNLVQNSNNAWNDISKNIKSTLDNKITPNLEDMFGETGVLAEYFGNIKEYSNKHWDGLSTYISGTTLPKITGDMKTAFLESSGSNDSIEGIVNLALSSINSNFEITETKSLEKVDSIDSAVNTAYTNIIEYLDKYSEKNDSVLEKAGTSYATFIEDSLNVATDATKKLSGSTQDFKRDLEYLKSEITKTTTETGKWEKKIDDAYAAIDPLLGHAYALEQLLYADAYEASIATDNFDYLADAADDVESSFSTMATEIYNAYGALKDAASDAAAAYNNLATAAGNAEQAAYDATNAINSIPDPPAGVNIESVSGAEDLLRSTGQDILNAMQSALPYLPVLTNLGGSRKINPLGNSPWGGLGFDSGGYTGTWTDGGIDDKNGKWAILHQKELVLNKTDTENMLSAVEIIRDIISDANKLASFEKINNSSNFNDTIEQRVEISATFPGVTEAIEIKQALEQLADNAYQVASRYKY